MTTCTDCEESATTTFGRPPTTAETGWWCWMFGCSINCRCEPFGGEGA